MDQVGVRVEIMPEAIVIPCGSSKQSSGILRRLGVMASLDRGPAGQGMFHVEQASDSI